MAKGVLITGARAAASLDLARDFAAAGWRVHLADSVTVRMARWSSLPAKHHLYPPPRHKGAAFRERIAQLVDAHGIDLIVPTCEEVFHLAAPALEETIGERLFAPDLPVLRKLHDKFAFAQAAGEWGLSVPESHAIETVEQANRFAADSRDWVFKPRQSRFGEHTLVAPDSETFRKNFDRLGHGWMAQRYVRGDEACVHAVAHRGELVACSSYASGWRTKGGACYAFEPLAAERHQCLREIAARLVRRADLHGQFGFDVIFDRDGDPHFLECNPRATSGVHLLAGGEQLARAIGEGEVLADTRQAGSYLGPAMVIFGLPRAIAGKRLREWRDCLRGGSDAISRAGRLQSVLGALADASVFTLRGLRRKISTSAAMTYDIEWNGEELA